MQLLINTYVLKGAHHSSRHDSQVPGRASSRAGHTLSDTRVQPASVQGVVYHISTLYKSVV